MGGQVFIMNLLDFRGLSKEDQEAIIKHYQMKNHVLLELFVERMSEYLSKEDHVGLAFLCDSMGALFMRGAEKLGADSQIPDSIANFRGTIH